MLNASTLENRLAPSDHRQQPTVLANGMLHLAFRDTASLIMSYLPLFSLASLMAINREFSKLCRVVLQKRFADLAGRLKHLCNIKVTLGDVGKYTPGAKEALLLAINRDDAEAIRLLDIFGLVDLTQMVLLIENGIGSLGDLAGEKSKYDALKTLVTLGVSYDSAERHKRLAVRWLKHFDHPLGGGTENMIKTISDIIILRDQIKQQKTVISNSQHIICK